MKGIKSSQAIGALFVMILATASAWSAYPETKLTASARQPAIYALGKLPGHDVSEGFGISADGRVAVGRSLPNYGYEAYRWTEAEGMIGMGFLPGRTKSVSLDVSADGSVIVGGSYSTPNRAFRWTQATGMVSLGVLPGDNASYAKGVSADGSVVVGFSEIFANPFPSQAFRWTSGGGMVGLGHLLSSPAAQSLAEGVSADGSVVVGYSSSTQGQQAFRWTAGSGMVGLGDLPGGATWSWALGVSADGRVVVGVSPSAAFPIGEAFIWTEETGMVGLGTLSSASSQSKAYAASADGSVVVGWSYDTEGRAFIWDRQHGMRNLRDVLTDECGLDLSGWGGLGLAYGVSADGLTIVGTGGGPSAGNSEGFVAVLPEPATLSLLALGGLAMLRRRRRRGSAFGSSSRPRIGRVVARRLALLALACLGIMTAGTAEAQDYLYVCQSQANIVSKYTTSGGIVDETLITGLYIPTDLAFDKNGNLLVLENSNRRIGLYTTSGDTINASFISTPFYPHNFALDGDGNIYVTGGGSFGAPSRIAKYTTSGTVVSHSFITTGLSSPAGIACDMNGNLFVANSGNGTIAQFTTSGAVVNTALVSGLGYPVDLVYDGAGHLFLADQQRGVREYTTSGELVAANLTPGFYGSCSIALDGRGNLFAGGPNASYPVPIGQFTISGEVVNPALITGIRTPYGLLVGPIPEPASLALLATGGLALLRRRRRLGAAALTAAMRPRGKPSQG
jgi:probable HAF family extracellular repeat protein